MELLLSHPLYIPALAVLAGLILGWSLHFLRTKHRNAELVDLCQRKITAAEEETQQRRDEAHKSAAGLALMRNQHNNATAKIEILEEDIATRNVYLERLNVEADDLREKYQHAQDSLAERIAKDLLLEEQAEQTQAQSTSLQQRVEQQSKELAGLRRDRDDWHSKTAHYQKDLETKSTKLNKTEQQLVAVREQLSLRETDVKRREATLDHLQDQFDQVSQQCKIQTNQLSAQEQEISGLHNQLEQGQPNNGSANGKQPLSLQTALAERDQQIGQLTRELDSSKAKLAPLQKQVTRREQQIDELQGELLLAGMSNTEPPAKPPAQLFGAPPTQPDDLKQIKGIGKVLEHTLHKLGVYQFDQVAAFSDNDLRWLDQKLGQFKGRATRDEWVSQASKLQQAQRPQHRPQAQPGRPNTSL